MVLVLAAVFFTLLAMIILRSGGEEPEESTTSAESLSVVPQRLRIRTEPNARAPVVTTASGGDLLTLVTDRGSWVRVRTSDGLVGWAERSSLERTTEQQRRLVRAATIRKLPPLTGIAVETTPLYSGPGIFYPIVGELSDGYEVTVYTRDHDFFAIEHGTGIAYADVEAIDVSAAGLQLDVPTTADAPPALTLPPLEQIRPAEPPPVTEPEIAQTPEPVTEPYVSPGGDGVYASVPPGGTQPREIEKPIPRYTAAARRANIGGTVVLRGVVRKDGRFDDVHIIQNLSHGLGEEALRTVRRWRFRPATYRGEPIDVFYTVSVNFRPR